jgi:hypothetical protein
MLDETNKKLAAIQQQNKLIAMKIAKRKQRMLLIKKYLIRSTIFITLFCIIFFPKESGTQIGYWIRDFFVTIYLIVSQSVS